mgnify:FL=1
MRALHEGQALFLLCSASGGSGSNQHGFRALSSLEENIINLGRYLQQCHPLYIILEGHWLIYSL